MPQHTASLGPGRPPAAKAAETRQRIVQTAREVFSELGYDAATFQAIAVRADLTRPAINHYFASKRVLWSEVVEQTNALIVSAGMERAQNQTSLLGRLSAFFSVAMQADSEGRSAAAFLVTSVLESQRHPELRTGEQEALDFCGFQLRPIGAYMEPPGSPELEKAYQRYISEPDVNR